LQKRPTKETIFCKRDSFWIHRMCHEFWIHRMCQFWMHHMRQENSLRVKDSLSTMCQATHSLHKNEWNKWVSSERPSQDTYDVFTSMMMYSPRMCHETRSFTYIYICESHHTYELVICVRHLGPIQMCHDTRVTRIIDIYVWFICVLLSGLLCVLLWVTILEWLVL